MACLYTAAIETVLIVCMDFNKQIDTIEIIVSKLLQVTKYLILHTSYDKFHIFKAKKLIDAN